jgi:hypothetical protein
LEVALPPHAAPDVLQVLHQSLGESDETYLSVVVAISLVEHQGSTTVLLHTQPPIWYLVSQFGVDRSTFQAFVTTLEANYVSLAGGRRPPDRPPPGVPGRN